MTPLKFQKPHYLKKDEFLSTQKETSVKQEVIDDLIAMAKESRKLEEKLLKKRAGNDRASL